MSEWSKLAQLLICLVEEKVKNYLRKIYFILVEVEAVFLKMSKDKGDGEKVTKLLKRVEKKQ